LTARRCCIDAVEGQCSCLYKPDPSCLGERSTPSDKIHIKVFLSVTHVAKWIDANLMDQHSSRIQQFRRLLESPNSSSSMVDFHNQSMLTRASQRRRWSPRRMMRTELGAQLPKSMGLCKLFLDFPSSMDDRIHSGSVLVS
jgi:hypothetical protein